MALYGKRDQYSDAPKFVVSAKTGDTGQEQFGNTVFGVDPTETTVATGVTHAGWVLRTEGSGGRAGRVFQETLVAMGSMATDATDFANTSTSAVANTTGTADDATYADS